LISRILQMPCRLVQLYLPINSTARLMRSKVFVLPNNFNVTSIGGETELPVTATRKGCATAPIFT